jgi:hypothetical protein
MPLIELIPVRDSQTCTINEGGTISFPHSIWQRLSWQLPCKIAVTYIDSPLTLLLRRADISETGFTLAYQARPATARTGAKITCSRFANEVLRTRVVLPLRGITPIFPTGGKYQLALILRQPMWITEDFSQAGAQRIQGDFQGVYQLIDSAGSTLRIGEGNISSRIRDHLKTENFVRNIRSVQYIALGDKEEASVMEGILIAQYENENGHLPSLNLIRS